MASLRSNIVISTVALVLVGSIRPAFNAVVNRVFGPEVNGRAAHLIALIFLASLPATAGLPTVMVRHVSRALGAKNEEEARGFAWLATELSVWLGGMGILAAIAHGLFGVTPSLSLLDLAFVGMGIAGYAYWRLYRSLLLSAGKALSGLWAEIGSVLALAAGLTLVVAFDAPSMAVAAFIAVYLVFAAVTLPTVVPLLRRGRLDPKVRRSFVNYTALWFVASGASLAVKELSILLLDARAERAVVGEFSVALSLLMVLALASRILELPLLHELSALAGEENRDRQRALTERALDWMTIIMVGAGCGLAILAAPILRIVGNVSTPAIAISFAVVAIAFTLEMIMTPANDLLVSEAHPGVLAIIGGTSLVAAFAWWFSSFAHGLLGVVVGLAIAHLVRAVAVAWYVRATYGVALLPRPIGKVLVSLAGLALIAAVHGRDLNPWLACGAFELALFATFAKEIRSMIGALSGGAKTREQALSP